MAETHNINNIEKEIHRRILSYSTSYHLTGHNAVHVTLDFAKGSTPHEQNQSWKNFLKKLVQITGLSVSKVAAFGWTFELNKRGKVWPHGHCLIYSTKDRCTGKTIAKLSRAEIDQLSAFWQRETGQTVKIRRIYDAPGLFVYIAGPRNLDVPGQQVDALESHNKRLLKMKMQAAA